MDGGKASCQWAKRLAGTISMGEGGGGTPNGVDTEAFLLLPTPHQPRPPLKGQKSRIWLCLAAERLQRAGQPQVKHLEQENLTGGWRLGKLHQG